MFVIAVATSGTSGRTGRGIGAILAVGPVDNHTTIASLCLGHHADNLLGILLGDLEKGDGRQEVDASDFHLSLDVTVDNVDDFTGIEMVALSTIDEETAVTLLGDMGCFLAACGIATALSLVFAREFSALRAAL